MAITLVLHEATRTGAPRIGGLIAREFAKREETRVIVMKNGPLIAWLADMLGADNMTIVDPDAFSANRSFEARLRLAETLLAKEPSDVVYVNSLASSVFTFAAARLGKKSILHVHEQTADMINLLRHQITKIETLSLSSGLVLAAGDVAEDLTKVFGEAADEALNFGVAVDFAEVRRAAEKPVEPPVNAIGSNFERRDRLVVGMCGHASPRKGVDIFFEVAEALPECDFLWIGSWSPKQTDDNIVYDRFLTSKLANLYVSGSVDNPYAYMRDMDIFFLVAGRSEPFGPRGGDGAARAAALLLPGDGRRRLARPHRHFVSRRSECRERNPGSESLPTRTGALRIVQAPGGSLHRAVRRRRKGRPGVGVGRKSARRSIRVAREDDRVNAVGLADGLRTGFPNRPMFALNRGWRLAADRSSGAS